MLVVHPKISHITDGVNSFSNSCELRQVLEVVFPHFLELVTKQILTRLHEGNRISAKIFYDIFRPPSSIFDGL